MSNKKITYSRGYRNELLPPPSIIYIPVPSGGFSICSSASFVRNESNSNIEITIPLGTDISAPNTFWLSPNIYLENDTFNVIKLLDEVSYPDNKDVKINKKMTYYHDVYIHYKLSKDNDNNFVNQRELRCYLVKEDGTTLYDSALFANQQPDAGIHDYIHLRGHITHELNDIIKIKLCLVQDNRSGDKSPTKMTIYRINWTILGLGS